MDPIRYNQYPLAVLRRSSRYSTQKELGEAIGMHKNRLQSIESGRLEADETTLRLIARGLGIPMHLVEAAYLEGRKRRLKSQVQGVEDRLKEIRRRAS